MIFETKLNMPVHMTIVRTTTSEIIDDEELEYWTLFETIVESEFNEHEHIIKVSILNDESENYKAWMLDFSLPLNNWNNDKFGGFW